MAKTIKQSFEEIQAFQLENPEQNRSGCLFEQDASGQTLKGYTIEDEVFKQCNFYTAKLINCTFIKCTFLNCNFQFVSMYNCQFIECELNNCNFSNAMLTDTKFKDCSTKNLMLNNIHCKNCHGLSEKDKNVVQDDESILTVVSEEEDENSPNTIDFITNLNETITKHFPKWKIETDNSNIPEYTLMNEDKSTGFSLYPDPDKNSTDTDNFWDLSFFFGGECIFTTDVNLFGLEEDEIVDQINQWKNEILKDNAEMLITRIIEIMEK